MSESRWASFATMALVAAFALFVAALVTATLILFWFGIPGA